MVLLHIPQHVLERDRGILSLASTAVDPFRKLKDRLVELLTPSLSCTSAPLGGRRPTEFMEVMIAALPTGELAGHLFKSVFLHRLPGDLKDLVAIQFQQLEAMELVKLSGTPGMPRRLGWRPSEQASSGMRRSSRRRHCWRRLWRPSPSTTRRRGMVERAGHGEPRRQQKGQPGTDGEVVYSLTENKMYFSTFICGRHQMLWRYSQADGGPV